MSEKLKKIGLILLFALFVISGICLIASCDMKTKTTTNKLATAYEPKFIVQDYNGYYSSDNLITDDMYNSFTWSQYYTDGTYGRYKQLSTRIKLAKGWYYLCYQATSTTNLRYMDYRFGTSASTSLDTNIYYTSGKYSISNTNFQNPLILTDTSAIGEVGGAFSTYNNNSDYLTFTKFTPSSTYLGNNEDYVYLTIRLYSNSSTNDPNISAFNFGIYKVADVFDAELVSNGVKLITRSTYDKRTLHKLNSNIFTDNSSYHYAVVTDDSAFTSGYQQAKENFKQDLFNEYQKGYREGEKVVSELEYERGKADGKVIGYNQGKEEGLALAENGSLGDMVESVADVPFSVVYNLLNFEVLGVNIWAFVTSLLSIGIVIFIIKKIKG